MTAGVDEVGRGCLAGPVVSAAVILKKGINLKQSLPRNYFFNIPRNFENIIRPKNHLDLDPFN